MGLMDSELVTGLLAGLAIIGVMVLLFFGLQQIASKPGGDGYCPPMLDKVLCGYCPNSDGGSHAGKCRTCSLGEACVYDDICGDIDCVPTSTSGGGSSGSGSGQTRYYASCSECPVALNSYSYSGYDYAQCNWQYNTCVAAGCSKILDNCR